MSTAVLIALIVLGSILGELIAAALWWALYQHKRPP